MTGRAETGLSRWPGLRLAIPRGYLFDELDPEVAAGFEAALWHGCRRRVPRSAISASTFWKSCARQTVRKSIVSAEAFAIHRDQLAARRDGYDPYVATRLDGGSDILAADYIAMHRERDATCAAVQAVTRPFDALLLPTTSPMRAAKDRAARHDRGLDEGKRPGAAQHGACRTISTGRPSPFPATARERHPSACR